MSSQAADFLPLGSADARFGLFLTPRTFFLARPERYRHILAGTASAQCIKGCGEPFASSLHSVSMTHLWFVCHKSFGSSRPRFPPHVRCISRKPHDKDFFAHKNGTQMFLWQMFALKCLTTFEDFFQRFGDHKHGSDGEIFVKKRQNLNRREEIDTSNVARLWLTHACSVLCYHHQITKGARSAANTLAMPTDCS